MISLPKLSCARLSGLAASFCLTACLTPAEEQQLKDDIFNLQTRVLQMESQTGNLGKEITMQGTRTEASINTRLDKFAIEIQRIKGDIDGLRVGVTTGQLPGSDPEKDGSVAKSLADIGLRLDALEENQNKILAAIDKAIETKKPEKKDSAKDKGKKASSLKTFDDLRTAFEKKKYKLIAEEGSKLVDETKNKKEKQEGLFIVAESLFKGGQTREAALKFDAFLNTEPKPKEHVAVATLRMGDCFKELGDVETAKIYYQEVIQKHASSDEAKQAKSKLAKL